MFQIYTFISLHMQSAPLVCVRKLTKAITHHELPGSLASSNLLGLEYYNPSIHKSFIIYVFRQSSTNTLGTQGTRCIGMCLPLALNSSTWGLGI